VKIDCWLLLYFLIMIKQKLILLVAMVAALKKNIFYLEGC